MWLLDFLTRCDTVEMCKGITSSQPVNVASPSSASQGFATGEAGSKAEATPKPVLDDSVKPGAGNGFQGHADGLPGAKPSVVPMIPTKKAMDALETQSAHSNTSTQKNSTRSVFSGVSSIGSEFVNEHIPEAQREVERIKSQMKSFVKGMVKGKDMNVLSVDGQLRSCTCAFDRKLRNYNITINTETRAIPLTRVKEVFQGTEPTDIDTPLDELCATFVLDTGECLSFRFKDVNERENFAMGLQIIVDGHQ